MNKKDLSKRAKNALKQISYSKLYRVYESREFIEVVVDRWGDACTFRIYNNGDITER